jgi:hypothetical protein
MSEQAIAALKEKRQKISEYISELYKRIGAQQRNLAYLDAAISLLQPHSPNGPPPKRHYRRSNYFRRNELQRMVMDGLREAKGPVSAGMLAVQAVEAKRLPESTLEAVADMVLAILRVLVKRGQATKHGVSRDARWRLRDPVALP